MTFSLGSFMTTRTSHINDGPSVSALKGPFGRSGKGPNKNTTFQKKPTKFESDLLCKANIPVANGVVHLIKRPLIIVALNLWNYLQNEVGMIYVIFFHTDIKENLSEINLFF